MLDCTMSGSVWQPTSLLRGRKRIASTTTRATLAKGKRNVSTASMQTPGMTSTRSDWLRCSIQSLRDSASYRCLLLQRTG